MCVYVCLCEETSKINKGKMGFFRILLALFSREMMIVVRMA